MGSGGGLEWGAGDLEWGAGGMEWGVCRGGQNEDRLPSTSISTKKRVGSCGFCLLPETFGKVGVEGTVFVSLKVKNLILRNRDRQRSTKIEVEGKTYILVHNF
jgi:hypothetical protein